MCSSDLLPYNFDQKDTKCTIKASTYSAEQFGGFFLTTGIVTVGTLVLFYALSGVLLHVAHAFKGSYYRGLNMFTVRQLSSRINTVSLSIGVISLILFLAITSVSSGLGICAGISDSIRRQTPYDASLSLHYGHADDKGGVADRKSVV